MLNQEFVCKFFLQRSTIRPFRMLGNGEYRSVEQPSGYCGKVLQNSAPGTARRRRCRVLRGCHWQAGWGLRTRSVDAGLLLNARPTRAGRGSNCPEQFGQRPCRRDSLQLRQKVHSNEQMNASRLSPGRSTSQHSQLGRNSSMGVTPVGGNDPGVCAARCAVGNAQPPGR